LINIGGEEWHANKALAGKNGLEMSVNKRVNEEGAGVF
jgi:hypothetical protein